MSKKAEQITPFKIKDYSVSGEAFQLIENKTYGFLETTPKPAIDKLPDYYKTEDYISHTDAKRNLFEKVYHKIRQISLKKKLKLINSLKQEEQNVLDFGCGTGDFLKIAQRNNWTVSGIEPNEEARKIANIKTNNSVFNSDYLNSFTKHSFDVITLWHVLEHIPNLEEQITQLKSLLKTKGALVIAVPNYKSYDANYYKQFWAAYDVPRHLWHFNQESISKLFSSFNMKIVNTKPMVFDSYYVSLLSEKYKTGTMNIFRAFWIGLKSNLKAKTTGEYSSLIYVIKNT
ncbi:class I SAM-dependent methyltransferase [Olleya sp. YS]|uniref:class I SAM-dependent methyltransferase n=1 Tax=Olleya sp. YS TaxID=3028318 RepID=UPI002434237C|nr:class I SAM-dependent methyltransferase [Olleya sp. YS]WGD35793.1 class I SAM-dependent methyltransferase [Olleya sp. YS]